MMREAVSPFAPVVVLTLWVVYYGARNHPPGVWVVRAQDAMSDNTIRPHSVFIECGSLEAARGAVPGGLARIDRQPGDDLAIVEVWL